MVNSITYRIGTSEDIPSFITFFQKNLPLLFPQYSPNTMRFLLEVDYPASWLTDRLAKGNLKVYLAVKKQGIVGFLLVVKPVGGVSFGEWLGVEEEHQKQGVASQLLALWQKDMLAQGAHALHFWTTKNNVEYYEKRGFISAGLFPKAWFGEDSFLIYKILQEPKEANYLRHFLISAKSRSANNLD